MNYLSVLSGAVMLYMPVGTTMFLYTLTLHRSTTVYIHPGPVYFYKQLFWCQSPLRDPAVPPAVPKVAWGAAELQICSWPWSPLFAPPPLCLFGCSPPCSSHTACATGILSHIYSHRKCYCIRNKHCTSKWKQNPVVDVHWNADFFFLYMCFDWLLQ